MKHVYPRAMALVQRGLVDLEQIVSHRYPLDRSAEAFEHLLRAPTDALKIVVEP
jgi:threonine dehydrogenase-like Zn-dependent dehydrogenase